MNYSEIKEEQFEEICFDFKALSDKVRIKIVLYLMDGEKNVNDIVSTLSMSQSSISHHLRILRDARILKTRNVKQEKYYYIADSHIRNILELSLIHLNCEV